MPQKVLIVDDSLFIRTMLRDILKEAGYEVAGEAVDGSEALNKFRDLNPDLVTLDIIMPGNQGLSVLKDMVKINPGAKVVMISALGQDTLVDEALKSGASGYIVKPFQDDRVIEEVRRALEE
ncbi:MAG: response regulator [Acidobacteriota bacterium]